MSSYYRIELENFLKTLDVKATVVLDVGGKQLPVDKRTKSWDVGLYKVLDLPEYNLDEPFEHELKADVVFCLEVFEYLIQPVVAMKNLAGLLKSTGKIYASFPLIYPVHNEVEFDSLRYTESGIRRIAKKAGLQITHITNRRAKTNTLCQYYSEDGMRGAKGINHSITGYIVELKHEAKP